MRKGLVEVNGVLSPAKRPEMLKRQRIRIDAADAELSDNRHRPSVRIMAYAVAFLTSLGLWAAGYAILRQVWPS